MSRSIRNFVRLKGSANTLEIQNYVITILGGNAKQACGAIGYCMRKRWLRIVGPITYNGRTEHVFSV